MSRIDTLRLIGSPGTGKVMAGELSRLATRALSRKPPRPRAAGSGMLRYPFAPDLADLAARYHRTCTRVQWDLYEIRTDRLEPLYAELLADVAADDRALWPARAGISVSARNVGAFAAGPRQIVGTVKNALIDGARARGFELRVEPRAPDLTIAVRVQDDAMVVSLDLGEGSLSQRGYRVDGGDAPLREHLAAALLMLARWDARSEILLDPMCGSGTICIEAALMAQAAPRAGGGADATLSRIPALAGALASPDRPRGPLFADTVPIVIGGDAARAACQAAQKNAARAGVGGEVAVVCDEFRALTARRVQALARSHGGGGASGASGEHGEARGVIVSNPPYGVRLGDRELTRLYGELSAYCDQFRGWRAGFLVGHEGWDRAFRRRPRAAIPLRNGALRVKFYLYDL